MSKKSAGLLMYREKHGSIEVFLVHPGGPFWAKKDEGAWSIPKGEFAEDEDPLEAAKREFKEETDFLVRGEFQPLDPLRQLSGKTVYAWAVEGDLDVTVLKSNTFSVEWPRGSGKVREFPEVDQAGWFTIEIARRKILKGQAAFLDQLQGMVTGRGLTTRATSSTSREQPDAKGSPQQGFLFDVDER
jgi:predicted NUDIX family NTP pyrophosphohydrolase